MEELDQRLVRLVRQAAEEREARIKVEHKMRGLQSALAKVQRRLVEERAVRTVDSMTKPSEPPD